MGKFINTERKQTIDDLVIGFKERMKNPYYLHSDKKPSIVTYYHLNHEKSMLDKGTGLEYARLQDNSPLKYNKIEGFFLYGIDRMEVSLQDGDYGLESDPIEGEAIILPNTIEPTPNDYFTISYVNETVLFRVNSVNYDTLEDGANFWKISYKLDQTDSNRINEQIVETYNMLVDNVGTKFKSVIKSTDYDLIESLEIFSDRLKEYYINLFFTDRVQTFIFYIGESRLYDPCMIEFLIRNELMKRKRNYIHVAHQLEMNRTFSLEYDSSMFRSVEVKDKNIWERVFFTARKIDEPNSTFIFRNEKYYEVRYIRKSNTDNFKETFISLNPALGEAIVNNTLFREEDPKSSYNMIIRYFNDRPFDPKDLDVIEHLSYQNNIELFYLMPFYIYIIEYYIKTLLLTSN